MEPGNDGYRETLSLIENATIRGSKTLSLRGLGLTSLPPELFSLTTLQVLDLGDNQLKSLSSDIGVLRSLRKLYLDHNKLVNLRFGLITLTALQTLYLHGNQLMSLPPELGACTSLQLLFLHDNQLISLPSEFGECKALREISLDRNQLTSLPSTICDLVSLRSLYLDDNQITSLPPKFGDLNSLRRLDLSGNRLTSLPSKMGDLVSLQQLDLSGNQLKSLPQSFNSLSELTALYLHNNPDLKLPSEVLGPSRREAMAYSFSPRPPAEIIAYYFSLQKAEEKGTSRSLNEAKVLFLGQPEAGKSSLIYALKHGAPTPDLTQTDGIVREILSLKTKEGKYVKRGGDVFRLNLWDFGGQEIYKATHTYFLTKRSIYVIVVTARQDTHVNDDLEEWLEAARTFGGGAPTWIVINKHDENPAGGPDEDALIRKYHPMLRGFIRTQCQHAKKGTNKGRGAGRGIEQLRDTLLAEAWAMPDARQELSAESLEVKSYLEKMKTPTLTLDQYRKMCGKKGVEDEVLQNALLDLWDKLGTVRYFPEGDDDVPSLQQTAILNPEWVTSVVYKVIGDAKLKKKLGLVTEKDLYRIVVNENSPPDAHNLIAHVMRRFSHLYDSDDGRMFIPQLLEDREPKLDWPEESLRFVYEYPVLPSGLVPSFIAKMHRYHDKDVTPWRKGCVLSLQGCRVRVLGDKKRRQVQISVVDGQGGQRRDALDQVRFRFEELHAVMAGMNSIDELIPVPGHPNAPMLSYRFLRTLEDKETQILVPANASNSVAVRVSIAETLGSIRGSEMKARDNRLFGLSKEANILIEYYEGNKYMSEDHSIGKNSININSQYGRKLNNCSIMVQQHEPGEKKDLLEELQNQVEEILKRLPEEKQNEAQQVADNLEMAIKQATADKPNRKWYSVSAEGLLEAATWVKDFSGEIAGTIKNLGTMLWPDFELPKLD